MSVVEPGLLVAPDEIDVRAYTAALDEQARISPNKAGMVTQAKILLHHAVAAIGRVAARQAEARHEIREAESRKVMEVSAAEAAQTAREGALASLEGDIGTLHEQFSQAAGAAGLDVKGKVRPDTVISAIQRREGFDPTARVEVSEPVRESFYRNPVIPELVVPEQPAQLRDPEPPRPTEPILPEAAVHTMSTAAKFGWLMVDLLLGFITGMFVGMNIGLVTGFVRMATLQHDGLTASFGTVLVLLLGPGIIILTGLGLKYAMYQLTSRDALRVGERIIIGILLAAAATVFVAEIAVGGSALSQLAAERFIKLSQMAPPGTILHRDPEWLQYLIATLVAIPYFSFEGWRGWSVGRARCAAREEWEATCSQLRTDYQEALAQWFAATTSRGVLEQEYYTAVVNARRNHESTRTQLLREADAAADAAYTAAIDKAEVDRRARQAELEAKAAAVGTFIDASPPAQRCITLAQQIVQLEETRLPEAQRLAEEARAATERAKAPAKVAPEVAKRLEQAWDDVRRTWENFESLTSSTPARPRDMGEWNLAIPTPPSRAGM